MGEEIEPRQSGNSFKDGASTWLMSIELVESNSRGHLLNPCSLLCSALVSVCFYRIDTCGFQEDRDHVCLIHGGKYFLNIHKYFLNEGTVRVHHHL